MGERIIVGSVAFFADKEGFTPKDHDYVVLDDKPEGYDFIRQTSGPKYCLFEWRRMTAEQFVEYSLHRGPAMQLVKFLVPEFVQEIGFTIEHLKQLKPLVDRLGKRHQYAKVIYDAYIANNAFELTAEQLDAAYEQYKSARSMSNVVQQEG